MISSGATTMAASSISSTRTLSSSSSSPIQETISEIVTSADGSQLDNEQTTTTTTLGNYKPPSSSSNQVSIGLNIIQSNNVTLSSNSMLRTGINVLQNEIVPTILGHIQTIPNDIASTTTTAISSSSRAHPSNIIVDNNSIITTTHHHNVDHKVITMGSSLPPSVDVNVNMVNSQSQCTSVDVIDDCCPSTTLAHETILMQITNDNTTISTSPIATLSLNPIVRQSIGVNNNDKSAANNNILFTAAATSSSAIDGSRSNEQQQQQQQHISITSLSIGEPGPGAGPISNSALCSNNFSSVVCSTSTSVGTRTGVVVSSTPLSSSSSFQSSSGNSNNNSNGGNGNSLVRDVHDASIVADELNMNADSLSSESLQIDDGDQQLEENEGYQDNTSSNSQQSGGGGSVSGVGGVNSITGGNGTSPGVITGNSNNSYISLLPPPVGTTGATGQSGEALDFKYLFEELCPVCGDKVSGYHYGLLTCESCKGFFKRTVQNKKVYTCVAERSCHIDKTQRKRCPYCRFQKCLEVGMKLEAVRADRMRGGRNKFGPMYKRDRARKLQMMRQRQLALQAIRGSMGGTADLKPGQISPTGYQQSYPSMNIKQEIQIPQVSSLTQSPDSSPSPIAIALGQVNPSTAVNTSSLGGNVGTGPGSINTSNVSGGTSGSGSHAHGNETGSSTSLQHTTDSKLCFDTGTNPTSTADSVSTEPLRVSPMIREFVQSIDDREWHTQLFALLQKQSYNQVEVDLFELMCKVLDQNLFSQVDWARNTVFFKDLKVDDQMKLLQHSWSDMLVLDHLHQRIHNNLPDETPLNNGQVFNLLGLGLLGVPQLADYFNELQNKLQELKFDMGDYVCMKFLILLNPNVRGIINKKTVLEGHENVQAALLDYTLTCYPTVTDKFSRLLSILPNIHAMAARGEEHLYLKHVGGNAPTQTLLMEMLHAKRKV